MDTVTIQGVLENFGDLRDFRCPAPEAVQDPKRLDGAPFLTFLSWAGLRKATGVARLHPASGPGVLAGISQGTLYTLEEDGRPFTAEVMRWLLEQRVVTSSQVQAAQALAATKPLLQVLFEQKMCSPQDLVGAIKGAREQLLGALFKPGRWNFAWQEGAAVKRSDPVAVDLVIHAVSAIRLMTRNSYANDMDPLLKDVQGRYPYVTPALTPAVSGIVFSDKEQKVLEQAADGTTTLKDGLAMSLLSRAQSDRLFLIASFLGFVEFRLEGLPKGGVETLEKELKSNLERLKTEDWFQRLGLHWTTHPKHYPEAFKKMADRWGPTSPYRRYSPFCAQVAEEAMELMEEAYRGIERHTARNDYRLRRIGKETILFGTDFLFKQANLALFREEFDHALEIIESAIDVLPRPEFESLRQRILKRQTKDD